MNLEDAVAARRLCWACACVGPQNGQPACPCTMTIREIEALNQAAHIVARLFSDLVEKSS